MSINDENISLDPSDPVILPKLEVGALPNFLKFIANAVPVVMELHNAGVKMSMEMDSGKIIVSGFYKLGDLHLRLDEKNQIIAEDKDGEKIIRSFEDLCQLNYRWWSASNPNSALGRGNYVPPERPFLDFFLKQGLVERRVIFVPKDVKE